MSTPSSIPREQNHEYNNPLKEQAVDENSCDSVEFVSKLKTIAKYSTELVEHFDPSEKSGKCDKEHGLPNNEQKIPKDSAAQSTELEEITAALAVENDVLSEDIERKPDDFYKQKSSDSKKKRNNLLKVENIKLRLLCKDISDINKRWQAYSKEAQSYIQRLEEIVQNEKERTANRLQASQEQKDITTLSPSMFACYDSLIEAMSQLQKKLLDSKQNEEFLREQFEELASESQEQIKLLNYQLKAYKEDYEAEKTEKRVAQTTSIKLSKELTLVKIELQDCKKKLKRVEEFSRPQSSETFLSRSPPHAFNLIEREARCYHLASDGENSVTTTSPKSVASVDEELSNRCDFYECPGCKTLFRSDNYLEHYEECQSNANP